MDQNSVAKMIIFLGLSLIGLGVLIWAATRFGLSLGKLPGDIQVSGEKTSFSFPVTTCILLSLLLSALLNFLFWLGKKL